MKIYNIISENCISSDKRGYFIIYKTYNSNDVVLLKFKISDIPLTQEPPDGEKERTAEFAKEVKRCLVDHKLYNNLKSHSLYNGSNEFPEYGFWLRYEGQRSFRLLNDISACSLYSEDIRGEYQGIKLVEDTFSKTYQSKHHYYNFNDRGNNEFMLFFPKSQKISEKLDADSDAFIIINSDVHEIYFNNFEDSVIENITIEEDPSHGDYNYFAKVKEIIESSMPVLSLSEVTNVDSDGAEISVTCTYKGSPLSETVYVESTSGYVSKRKIVLDENGEGRFKFIPLGLSSGDVSTVKVGFRLYTGIDKLDITVV